MEEKITNSIAYYQGIIFEIEKIKQRIQESENNDIRLKIETKHWYGFSEPFLGKDIHKLEITKTTMQKVLDELINKEKERINKLIDMEIERRINNEIK